MSGIFYTEQLTKSSRPSQGSLWRTVEAYFPELQVFATISLSMYQTQNAVSSPDSSHGLPRRTSSVRRPR